MKIEIGESLMRSWLRHVQGCQFAELNWKPSSSWPIYGDAQQFMDQAREHFKQKIDADIFQNTHTASQLFKQAEIDVLGLRLNENGEVIRIHSVDIAFHESGLNYRSRQDTICRVLKKLIRSAMIMQAYFGDLPTQTVFASPVVGPSYVAELENVVGELGLFLSSSGFSAEVAMFVNEKFREIIFDPVCSVSTDVADTSELFLRSYQLMNIFDTEVKPLRPVAADFTHSKSSEILRIEFDPASEQAFKAELLKSKLATITILYDSGKTEQRLWNAQNFRESSDLIGNLRSRPEFRRGEWQRLGIKSVKVKIAG